MYDIVFWVWRHIVSCSNVAVSVMELYCGNQEIWFIMFLYGYSMVELLLFDASWMQLHCYCDC